MTIDDWMHSVILYGVLIIIALPFTSRGNIYKVWGICAAIALLIHLIPK